MKTTMKTRRNFLTTVGALSGGVFLVSKFGVETLLAQDDPDVILKAMRDELERSRQLRVPGSENEPDNIPYFISYTLDDAENFSAVATLGALTGSSLNRFREPLVEVRVGNYDFDNTGHVLTGSNARLRLANLADRIMLHPAPTMMLIVSAEKVRGNAPVEAIAAFRKSTDPLGRWMDHIAGIR